VETNAPMASVDVASVPLEDTEERSAGTEVEVNATQDDGGAGGTTSSSYQVNSCNQGNAIFDAIFSGLRCLRE